MRTLIISGYPPSSPENSSHGIYKRLETFFEAFAAEGEVDCLYFAGVDSDVTAEARDRMQRACRERWGDRVQVFLGQKGSTPVSESFVTRYLRPILGLSLIHI